MADLMEILERVFPFSRRITVETVPTDDGTFVAELLLPVRHGESLVQVCRHPLGTRPETGHLGSSVPDHLITSGNGRWGWLVGWDGVASHAEIDELVVKRVLRHPQLGDTSN